MRRCLVIGFALVLALLALLAMADPRSLSVDSLIASLWAHDDALPNRTVLQSHVSRIRKHLGSAAPRLENVGAGYRLRLEPGELDAARADLVTALVAAVVTIGLAIVPHRGQTEQNCSPSRSWRMVAHLSGLSSLRAASNFFWVWS